MSVDWKQVAKDYWDEQPHPHAPSLKIKEFATAVKLATATKFGGHAEPHEAALFWQEFAPGGVPLMSPQEYMAALDQLAPLSYTYHGRPPSLAEIIKLKDEAPAAARKHYEDLPHRYLPHLPAGRVVAVKEAAKPHAQEHLQRDPVFTEIAYLAHSNESPVDYYRRIGEQNTRQGVLSTQERGGSGDGGLAPAGRQAPDQRNPRG